MSRALTFILRGYISYPLHTPKVLSVCCKYVLSLNMVSCKDQIPFYKVKCQITGRTLLVLLPLFWYGLLGRFSLLCLLSVFLLLTCFKQV